MFGIFSQAAAYDLSGQQFKERYKAAPGAVLVDVRTPGEYHSGTIKGARNMDMMSPNFLQNFLKLDKDKEYFLFCRSGNRSGQACRMLTKEGYKVYNLDGGIADWPQ